MMAQRERLEIVYRCKTDRNKCEIHYWTRDTGASIALPIIELSSFYFLHIKYFAELAFRKQIAFTMVLCQHDLTVDLN